jgi:hypothetical protein
VSVRVKSVFKVGKQVRKVDETGPQAVFHTAFSPVPERLATAALLIRATDRAQSTDAADFFATFDKRGKPLFLAVFGAGWRAGRGVARP